MDNTSVQVHGQHCGCSPADDVVPFVERGKQHGVEVDRPDPVVGLFKADVLVDERVRRVTNVTGARDDTLLFRDNPSSQEFSVAKSALTRVDLSMRRGSPVVGTFSSVLLGGGVGIGAGLALGYAIVQHDRSTGNCPDGNCGLVLLYTLPLGFVAGAITGGIVGHHIARESWQHLPDPRQIRIAWAIRPHNGIGVGVTVLTQ